MHENTHKFLSQLQAGHMPNIIELMSAINTMSDELYEAFAASSNLAEATKSCLSVPQHGQNRCGECG